MDIREMPIWEKPREKLWREGKESLTNAEILAILLRTGTRRKTVMDLAGEILSLDESGLRFLADCSPEELKRIHGLGEAKICELMAAVELGRRIASGRRSFIGRIGCSSDVADMFMEKMRYYEKEHFLCLMINAKGDIIEEREVSVGDICSSAANPREVFSGAIRRNAGSVLFLHNHPSGDPTPSQDDVRTTRRLVEAGELLGIPVLDHIIIGDGRFISMSAEGLMERG